MRLPFNADWLSRQPKEFRDRFNRSLTPNDWRLLEHNWEFWARPSQLPPDKLPNGQDWRYWVILAGRGFGKTRTGAEWVRKTIQDMSFVNLIAATADDARDIMVEGESGILAICPNNELPTYVKSERKLKWPNGAVSLIFTADEPERLRGKQHAGLWADEVASWRYPEAWDQAQFGLRIGPDPRAVVTTTPKPTPLIKELCANEWSFVTTGTTYDNRANLAEAFYSAVIKKYEGSRLGRQELLAQILDDNPNALWQRTLLDDLRVNRAPEMTRIVVAVDPQSGEDGAETGIIVVGIGHNEHGYVLDDMTIRGTPSEWAEATCLAYHRWRADRVVAEVNQGGKMVEHTIRTADPNIAYTAVTARVGKRTRAEPVSALYEQGRVHHVGQFGTLEDQMCEWVPTDPSPDRMDALVWGMTELFLGEDQPSKGYGF